MKRFKLILKGVLLWVTAFAVMLFISGVDSIYDNGYFIHSIIVCVVLCYTCYKLISEEEFEILTLYKWFNKITGEESMEWYNSGNSTLRTLALSAYTEDELKFNLKYINSKVCNTCFCTNIPANEAEKYNTLTDLAIIAKFFNGSWKKTTNNTGYFLGNFNAGCGPVVDTCNGVGVYQHNTVQYAGVVYFRNQEDAIKAVKILGKRVKSLFD